jgi:hypothetical protein
VRSVRSTTAIDYIEALEKTKRLRLAVDLGKVTMNQLFDDFLASVATRSHA